MRPSPLILPEVRATLVLAVPLVLTQLAQMTMSFVDVVMIGRLGTAAMAAGVLGSSSFFMPLLVCVGVVLAVSPSVAQSHGAGDGAEVGQWARQGLWLATFLGLGLVVLYGYGEAILLAAGQEPETAALAGGYLRAIRWGALPNLWFAALRGLCEGLGRPRPVLVAVLLAAGVNVLANWVLMYGNWGFPALGVVGTGWASALAMTTMFVLLSQYVRLSPLLRRYRVFAGLRRPDGPHLKRLFRLGWPIGVNFGLEAGLFLAATFLVGLFGTAALAAHQVAINAASVTFMVPLGIGMAGTVRVGQAVGRGDGAGAARAGWTAIALGAAFMLGAALLFWLRPEWVVWLYTGQGAGSGATAEVVEMAALLLGVAAFFQLFDGVQVTAAGALRGLKDTRVPMLIGAVSYWVVGMATALGLGFGLGLGATGIWWGLTLGLAAAAVLLTARLRRRLRAERTTAPAALIARP